jgi:O-antigen/teichoic acid export membrane protein
MVKRSQVIAAASVVPCVFIIGVNPDSHAYLDAGTGSIVLQAVLGALVGALVAIKLFWNQIKAFFSRLFRRSKDHGEVQDDQH